MERLVKVDDVAECSDSRQRQGLISMEIDSWVLTKDGWMYR